MSQSTNPAVCVGCGYMTDGYEDMEQHLRTNHATDAIEATTDRTNTEPKRELVQNLKENDDGTISPIDPTKPSSYVQGSTNPKDDLDEIFKDCESYEAGVPNSYEFDQAKAKARIQEYVTLARIDEAKHYCDEGHYHDKKRDIAMLPSERVEELERLHRDSQLRERKTP